MQRRNKRAKERNVHACPTLRKTFPQTFFHQPERVEEEGGGGFYTILALPHARLPFPLLVNELSKHRVFVVRANGSMRGTEPVSARKSGEQKQHFIFCFLPGVVDFRLPRFVLST